MDACHWCPGGKNRKNLEKYLSINFERCCSEVPYAYLSHHREATGDNANLSFANLKNADMSYAKLERVSFVEADMRGTDLSHANLEGACLIEAKLNDANLQQACLNGVNLKEAWLQGAKLMQVRLEAAEDLRKAHLEGADLSYSLLDGTWLQEVNLTGANLYSTRFRGVRLQKTIMEDTFMFLADIRGTALSGASLKGAYVRHACFGDEEHGLSPRLSQRQLDQTWMFEGDEPLTGLDPALEFSDERRCHRKYERGWWNRIDAVRKRINAACKRKEWAKLDATRKKKEWAVRIYAPPDEWEGSKSEG